MLKPRSWAVLSITGDFSPDEISNDLNISPDYTQDKNVYLKKNGFWQIHSKLSAERSLEEHLWEILKKIAPVRLVFKKISANFECVIYASVEFSDVDISGISLSPRILTLLGNLGVGFELNPWLNDKLQSHSELNNTT